jgi:hypothetical protein
MSWAKQWRERVDLKASLIRNSFNVSGRARLFVIHSGMVDDGFRLPAGE